MTANTAESGISSSPEVIAVRSLPGEDISPDLAAQIDAIFFESSGRTGFASPQSDISRSWGSGWGVRLLDRMVADYYEK